MNDSTRTTRRLSDDPAFQQEAYVSLADEFDPMGADPTRPVTIDEFDPESVEAATRYATRHAIPLPWEVRSLDVALDYVREAERGPAECDGFSATNAWGPCSKCGMLLGDHAPNGPGSAEWTETALHGRPNQWTRDDDEGTDR